MIALHPPLLYVEQRPQLGVPRPKGPARPVAPDDVEQERRVSSQGICRGKVLLESRNVVHGNLEPPEERPHALGPVVPALRMAAATEQGRRRGENADRRVLDGGGHQVAAEGQVLVGDLEPIDDPDQAPGEVGVDGELRVTSQHPLGTAPSRRHPVRDELWIVVAQRRLGPERDEQVGRPGPIGQVGVRDESEILEQPGGDQWIDPGQHGLAQVHRVRHVAGSVSSPARTL